MKLIIRPFFQRGLDLNKALEKKISEVKRAFEVEVELLLDQGADANMLVQGYRILCYLINSIEFQEKKVYRNIIELLLDHGADIRRQCGQGCALDVALQERRWDLVSMFRDRDVEKTQMYRLMEAEVDSAFRRLQEEYVQD